jgi:ribonuclease P protein component
MNFPKSARVRTRGEYLEFFKGSSVARLGPCLVFRIANTKGEARLGITVKTKANSVYRNKIKRQVRESFRLAIPHAKNSDYNVVIPMTTKLKPETIYKIRTQLDAYWTNEHRA